MAQQQRQLALLAFVACVAAVAVHSTEAFEPVVDTGINEFGGRHVSVHVPAIFDLKLDTRPNHGGARMSQTVMSGLVSIKLDRTRNAEGKNQGPIEVRMFGMPVYRNEEARNGGFGTITPVNPISNLTPELPPLIGV